MFTLKHLAVVEIVRNSIIYRRSFRQPPDFVEIFTALEKRNISVFHYSIAISQEWWAHVWSPYYGRVQIKDLVRHWTHRSHERWSRLYMMLFQILDDPYSIRACETFVMPSSDDVDKIAFV